MENKPQLAAMATATCVFAFAVWPQGAEAAPFGDRSVARSSTLGHLFVLDVQQKAVFRYRLAQDGLPAAKPDGVLYPEGTVYPEGLAVDVAGHIYVADAHGWGCDYTGVCLPAGGVAEYAANATGPQQPTSILRLSQNNPDRLKIDDSGRLYVHYNASQDIAIFAKGAHGNDPPISIIPPFYHPELASDFVIAKSSTLYVLDSPGPVMLYDDALQSPSQPNRLMWPDGGYEFAFSQTLALDDAKNRLYVQFFSKDEFYWNKVNFGVRPLSSSSVAIDPLIFTGDCGSKSENDVGGSVVVKDYVIISCNINSDVLVYRSQQFGRQRAPVETLGQGTLLSPWEMAVGP